MISRSGNAVTNTRPALAPLNRSLSSLKLGFPLITAEGTKHCECKGFHLVDSSSTVGGAFRVIWIANEHAGFHEMFNGFISYGFSGVRSVSDTILPAHKINNWCDSA